MKLSLLFFTYIVSFFYITFLCVLYFSKGRLNNNENKIYKTLLITNLFGVIIQILCDTIPILNNDIYNFIISKLILVYFYVWILLFFLYVLEISSLKTKRIKGLNIFTLIVSVFLIVFLPYNLVIDKIKGVYYIDGLDTKFLYVVSSLYIFIMTIITVIKHKSINKKKVIPVYILVVFFLVSGAIQYFFPAVTIIVQIETFICLIMYFTIENPDLQMIEQLNYEKERADRANNAKTEFLSSMSHEIRTPLNAIDGFSQLILEEDNIDTIKEEAHDIMAASQNLLEIVNGILDISKIEADKLEIVNVEYEPAQIFKDVAVLAKSRIGEKPIEFKEHIAEDLPDYLNGDYTRIKQITLNLLTNAVKYTKDGYVDYSVRCVRQGDVCRLIIMVKDTGIGIKSENIDKLFNKFERFDKEQNITIEGTGLGLAITKKLVDLMHGKIIADSRYGKGSIFAVVVDQKIVDKVKDKTTEEVKEDKKTFEGYKVLVVDDNKINLKVASRLLDSYKIAPDLVDSGFECISKIKSGIIYSLILMDDMMPKMSGTETFKKLKEIEGFNTPVIALTANAIAGMKEKYLKEGFNDYISKPIDKKELERVLNKYLN